MKKLLALFRGHRPDVRLLSEHLDGRLDAPATAALEDHLASCDACRTRLEELRDVRAALAVLPAAEPPRSFRLSPAEARPPQPARAAQQPRWMAGMPALSAAAVLLFAVLVGAEFYGTGGGTQFASAPDADNGELLGLFNRDGERVPQTAGAMEHTERAFSGEDGAATADDGRDEAPIDIAGAPTPIAPATGGLPEEDGVPDAAQGDDVEAAPPVGIAPPDTAPAPEEVLRTAVDDDGGIGGLRIAQALAGLIAVAAGVAAGIRWYRGREAQA